MIPKLRGGCRAISFEASVLVEPKPIPKGSASPNDEIKLGQFDGSYQSRANGFQ